MALNPSILISAIDEWLKKSNKTSSGAPEAAAFLDKNGLLKDSKDRPGKPLRELLRKGMLPHAYQNGVTWIIPISNSKIPTKKLNDETPILIAKAQPNLANNNPLLNYFSEFTMQEARTAGFDGFLQPNILWDTLNSVPREEGIYTVWWSGKNSPKFLEKGTGAFYKGKHRDADLVTLSSNWNNQNQLLYIGKATNLRSRISLYLKYGRGFQDTRHYGGSYIWQLEDQEKILFSWKPTPGENSREIEKSLLIRYHALFGKLPFANRTF